MITYTTDDGVTVSVRPARTRLCGIGQAQADAALP